MAEPGKLSPAGSASPPGDLAPTASAWLARRDRGLTAAEADQFARWQAADPRHAEEFGRLASDWARLDQARGLPELVKMAQQLEAATRRTEARWRPSWLGWGGAIAAAAALAVLIWPGRGRLPGAAPTTVAATYQVVPNAARSLTLADGSVVELRGDSEVLADFSPAERRVRLVRGEAHFSVTKNPARPFVVIAGPVAVRAVGTAFNVRLEPAVVEVLVTEGRVRVDEPARGSLLPVEKPGETPLLIAGQRVQIAIAPAGGPVAAAEVAQLAPTEIDRMLAWQNTWLVFNRTPLEEAVAAFNQHATGGAAKRLALGDATLRGRRLGGTFRADNPEGFVRLLEQGFDIRAESRDGQIVLRAR